MFFSIAIFYKIHKYSNYMEAGEQKNSSEEIKKVFLINQKRNWAAWSAIAISLVSIIWSGFWSFHTYNQLLPLQKSNVIFSESNLRILNNQTVCSSDGECLRGDQIELTLTNIGRAPAQNISFKIYGVPYSNGTSSKLFDNQLVNDVQPGASVRIGNVGIGNTEYPGQPIALIFILQYTDSLTSLPMPDTFFFYHYTLGTQDVFSLIDADYSRLYKRLQVVANKYKDQTLLEFLKGHPTST